MCSYDFTPVAIGLQYVDSQGPHLSVNGAVSQCATELGIQTLVLSEQDIMMSAIWINSDITTADSYVATSSANSKASHLDIQPLVQELMAGQSLRMKEAFRGQRILLEIDRKWKSSPHDRESKLFITNLPDCSAG